MTRAEYERQEGIRRMNALDDMSVEAVQKHWNPFLIRAMREAYQREREKLHLDPPKYRPVGDL